MPAVWARWRSGTGRAGVAAVCYRRAGREDHLYGSGAATGARESGESWDAEIPLLLKLTRRSSDIQMGQSEALDFSQTLINLKPSSSSAAC